MYFLLIDSELLVERIFSQEMSYFFKYYSLKKYQVMDMRMTSNDIVVGYILYPNGIYEIMHFSSFHVFQ